ncbi:MAG: endo-1,4-beta-xylanase [Scytonematopsis contorta HA4267-MV1]|jgi:endo-1,4-beta-xylanase|nr:endo-1,4-beta-xylanase [Scytonematopsis contorta HA4267-MV1]
MDRRKFLTTATCASLTSLIASKYFNSSFSAQDIDTMSLGSSFSDIGNLLKQNKINTLKDAARSVNKFYGTSISETIIEQDKTYAALVARECSIAVTEGAFKWIVIQPLPGQFNFALADKAINFCARNNMKLRAHTLLWHMARPSWLPYPASLADVQRHFNAVMGRYRNNTTLYSWDIVNEVIADSPAEAEDQVYGLRKGVKPEYIRDVFQIAQSIDSSKEFVINDYGCEDAG